MADEFPADEVFSGLSQDEFDEITFMEDVFGFSYEEKIDEEEFLSRGDRGGDLRGCPPHVFPPSSW